MRRAATILALALFVFVGLAGCSNKPAHDRAIDSLIDAENKFAGDIAEKGIKTAFLDNLGENSVIFRPEPASAVAVYEAMPETPGLLSWHPVLADVSAAGDLGFTTGSWEFSPDGPGTEARAFGDYVTVWIKDPDDVWKIAADIGVPHDPSTQPAPELKRRGYDRVASPYEPAAELGDVLDAERDLWMSTSTMGFGPALSAVAAPDMVLLRFGLPPASGPQGALMLIPEAKASWEPAGGAISESGDLAYTFGVVVYKGNEGDEPIGRASYLRIWERLPSGAWNVVLDVTNPMPLEQHQGTEGGRE